MKKIILILFLTFSYFLTAQNPLAKIEYSYAEEAFTQQDYKKALDHLEEVKSILGSTNARIMYLEINSLVNTFSVFKNTKEDYLLFKKIDELTRSYISNFENDVPVEKLKLVYEIQKQYKSYAIEVENLIKGEDYYNNKDYENALLHFLIACKADNPEACKMTAYCYRMKKDFENNKKFIDKAISLGSISAKYNMGTSLYYGGSDYNKDIIKGVQLMEEAYNSGYLHASTTLGYYYIGIDDDKAKKLLLVSYKKMKNKRSALYLFYYYDDLRQDEQLLNDAFEYVNEILIKKPNSGLNNHYKGFLLIMKKQYSEAKKYYEIACVNDHAFSCNFLATLYLRKSNEPNYGEYGITRDKQKGNEFKEKACALDPQYCN